MGRVVDGVARQLTEGGGVATLASDSEGVLIRGFAPVSPDRRLSRYQCFTETLRSICLSAAGLGYFSISRPH